MSKPNKPKTPKTADPQLEEFETRDLGKDIEASGVKPRLLQRRNQATSILLPTDLIDKLREKAAKRHIGYQTMLKIIVAEQLDKY
jgi:predicted DNA binding CopG/RHH family protein